MTTAIAQTLPRTLLTGTLALAATLAGFAATVEPAHAGPRGGAYVVTLASPIETPRREIVDGVLWRCAGERCSAPADGERTLALCGKVARKFGAVATFTGPQGALPSRVVLSSKRSGAQRGRTIDSFSVHPASFAKQTKCLWESGFPCTRTADSPVSMARSRPLPITSPTSMTYQTVPL